MISKSRILTLFVICLGIVTVGALVYTQFFSIRDSYNPEIVYSFTKSPVTYDYSCEVNEYQVQFVIKNTGPKNVDDLSVSITNPDCEGSLPVFPSAFNSSSTLNFAAQTTAENGTLTVSGNNTFVQIMF
jgi:hypothetical protein